MGARPVEERTGERKLPRQVDDAIRAERVALISRRLRPVTVLKERVVRLITEAGRVVLHRQRPRIRGAGLEVVAEPASERAREQAALRLAVAGEPLVETPRRVG